MSKPKQSTVRAWAVVGENDPCEPILFHTKRRAIEVARELDKARLKIGPWRAVPLTGTITPRPSPRRKRR